MQSKVTVAAPKDAASGRKNGENGKRRYCPPFHHARVESALLEAGKEVTVGTDSVSQGEADSINQKKNTGRQR
jgi:hypothetical protein